MATRFSKSIHPSNVLLSVGTALMMSVHILFGYTCQLFAQDYGENTPTGNTSAQERGDAIYSASTWYNTYNHTGLYYEYDPTGMGTHRIIHVRFSTPAVVEDTLPNFKAAGSGIYFGAHSTNPSLTTTQRNAVIITAIQFRNDPDLHYTVWGQIDWLDAGEGGDNQNGWNGTVSDLDNIRCDGLVECCYEMNGIAVWGKNKTHYSIVSYPAEHNDAPNLAPDPLTEVCPVVQRGAYPTLADGQQYTKLRASVVTAPTTSITFPGSDTVSSPTYSSSGTFNVTAVGLDSDSGVNPNAYYFKYAAMTWPSGTWSPWADADSYPSSSSLPFSGVNGVLYAFTCYVLDKAGNASAWSTTKYVLVDTSAPSAPTDVAASPSTWSNTNSFGISWSNPSDTSGIAGAYYKVGSAPTSATDGSYTTTKPFTASATATGGQAIYVWLKDNAGNVNHNNRSSATLYYGQAPSITSSAVTTATVDIKYSYDVNASGNPAPAYSLSTNPAGMTINSTSGVISWTPTSSQAGDHAVTVVAANGISPNASQQFQITVTAVNAAPLITSSAVTTPDTLWHSIRIDRSTNGVNTWHTWYMDGAQLGTSFIEATATTSDYFVVGNTNNGAAAQIRNVRVSTGIPGTMTVSPETNLSASGPYHEGPYSGLSSTYTVGNEGTGEMTWTASAAWWLPWAGTIEPSGGTLTPGETVQVIVTIDELYASQAGTGLWTSTVTFVNTSTGAGNTARTATLTIQPTVTIDSPTTETTWNTSSPTIDLAGTSSEIISLTWNNSSSGSSGVASITNGPVWYPPWSATIPLVAGDNIITVKAEPAPGVSASDTITVTYTPPISLGQVTLEMLSGMSEGTWGNGNSNPQDPYNTYYEDTRSQFIVLASELSGTGLRAGDVTSIFLRCSQVPGRTLENVRIRIQHTTSTTLSSFVASGWGPVNYGPATHATGEFSVGAWKEYALSTPFTWNGTQNMIIELSVDGTAWSSGGGMFVRTGLANGRTFSGRADSATSWPFDTGLGALTQYGHIPELKLTGEASLAANDGLLATDEDVQANDVLVGISPYGTPITYSIVNNGSKGVATVTDISTGAFTYVPNANANGSDSFTFRVKDGAADSNIATISVTITPVNDAPVSSDGSLAASEDVTANASLSASDVDGTVSVTISSNRDPRLSSRARLYTEPFSTIRNAVAFIVRMPPRKTIAAVG